MPAHDYTPGHALAELLARMGKVSADLTQRIQVAIDRGKEVQVRADESSAPGPGRPRKRQYWVTQPYTDQEAMQVALSLLRAHLVESRAMVNSAFRDFIPAGLAEPKAVERPEFGGLFAPLGQRAIDLGEEPEPEASDLRGADMPKPLEIEVETEAVKEKRGLSDQPLEPVAERDLESLKGIFETLGHLTDFRPERRGNAR